MDCNNKNKELELFLQNNSLSIAEALIEKNSGFYAKHNVNIFGIKKKVSDLIKTLKTVLFPALFETDTRIKKGALESKLKKVAADLNETVLSVFALDCEKDKVHCMECKQKAQHITMEFIASLPEIREVLNTDIDAAYNGDPAARSRTEILFGYPSIEAVSIYRMAHRLFSLDVPLIPRIMTEYAHQITGIDIHPGAQIGRDFFIDHGTGVVIGETCVIGNGVKLYQGVTLGAKSFQLDENGNPVKGIKRHPDIEDNVVIYAGATILGGDTVIGHDSIIGGNVWITESIPPYTTVYHTLPLKTSSHGPNKIPED